MAGGSLPSLFTDRCSPARPSAGPRAARPSTKCSSRPLQSNPGDIQLSAILAEFYRGKERLLDEKKREMPRAEREKKADLLMDQMIKANPANADAYLVRYYYRLQNRLPGAEEDLRLALKFGPDNIGVLLAAAEKAKQDGMANPELPLRILRGSPRPLRTHPADRPQRRTLLSCFWEISTWGWANTQRAVETWRRGLKEANKDSIVLHHRLAGALVTLGRVEEAAAMLNALDALIALQRHSPAWQQTAPRWNAPATSSAQNGGCCKATSQAPCRC